MTTLPTAAQVGALPLRADREVPTEWIDANGHMNVQFYLAHTADGLTSTLDEIGIDDTYRSERKQTLFTAEQHVRYLAECRLGDRVTVHSRLLGRSERALHAVGFLVNRTTDQLAYVLDTRFVHVDMTTRRPCAMPDDVTALIDASITDTAALPWDVPVADPIAIRSR